MRIAYAMILVATACTTNTDYGDATDATTVDLVEAGGFAPAGVGSEVHIAGGNVSFVKDGVTGVGLLDEDAAQQIVDALANVHFLGLRASYIDCPAPATDASTATITADLEPGANTVSFYKGCSGGEYDLLGDLERKIFTLSGFTAWSGGDRGSGV